MSDPGSDPAVEETLETVMAKLDENAEIAIWTSRSPVLAAAICEIKLAGEAMHAARARMNAAIVAFNAIAAVTPECPEREGFDA
jgi:hypothetical protein